MKFSEAFKAARKSGKKTFTWNGKRYNTRLKGESKEQWLSRLGGSQKKAPSSQKTASRPKARPKVTPNKEPFQPSLHTWPPEAVMRPQPRPTRKKEPTTSPWFYSEPGLVSEAVGRFMSSLNGFLSAEPKGNGKQSKYMSSSEYKKLKAKSDRKKRKYGFK